MKQPFALVVLLVPLFATLFTPSGVVHAIASSASCNLTIKVLSADFLEQRREPTFAPADYDIPTGPKITVAYYKVSVKIIKRTLSENIRNGCDRFPKRAIMDQEWSGSNVLSQVGHHYQAYGYSNGTIVTIKELDPPSSMAIIGLSSLGTAVLGSIIIAIVIIGRRRKQHISMPPHD